MDTERSIQEYGRFICYNINSARLAPQFRIKIESSALVQNSEKFWTYSIRLRISLIWTLRPGNKCHCLINQNASRSTIFSYIPFVNFLTLTVGAQLVPGNSIARQHNYNGHRSDWWPYWGGRSVLTFKNQIKNLAAPIPIQISLAHSLLPLPHSLISQPFPLPPRDDQESLPGHALLAVVSFKQHPSSLFSFSLKTYWPRSCSYILKLA